MKDFHQPKLPIHSRSTSGYPVGILIENLLRSTQKAYTVQPLGVAENAAFIIDFDSVNHEDLKADDMLF